MIIRQATIKDIQAIKPLLDNLNTSSTELLPNFFQIAQTTDEDINNKLEDKTCSLIVAEKNSEVLGVIEMFYKETGDVPELVKTNYIYIQRLVVNPKYRGLGIGKALMYSAKDWANEKGVDIIRLSVIPTNHNAIGFYKSLGYEAIMTKMELNLK